MPSRGQHVLCALAGGLLACAVGAQELPDFGDAAAGSLSPADERRLGEAFMREIRANLVIIEDAEVESYVQSLGHRLAAQSDGETQPFTFFVIRDEAVNAFAGPGGYVGVNAGLIMTTDLEGEFASVLAHEIAHVTQRHIARAFELGEKTSLPVLAGIIAAIVLGTQSPALGQAAAATVVGTAVQSRLRFGRNAEREADRVGMRLLQEAGFDPRAMPAFFETLQSASRYYNRPPEFLSTHPVTTSRVADTRARAEQYPYRQHADSLSYHLVKAKLRVLLDDDPEKSLRYFEDKLESGKHRSLEATAYGWGLALTRSGQAPEAREVFVKLVEENPDRMAFQVAMAENELRAGKVATGLKIYLEAYGLFPDNKMVVRGFSEALVKTSRGTQALEIIEAYARRHGMDASLHRISAQAHADQGDVPRSRLSLAEHYYLSGQLDAAIHQLQLGSDVNAGDYYVRARIEARLKELRHERRARSDAKG